MGIDLLRFAKKLWFFFLRPSDKIQKNGFQ